MIAIFRLCLAQLLLSITCAACQKESSSCDYLADGYERLETNLRNLSVQPFEQVPDTIVSDIQKCWAAHPFGGPQHSILLKDVRSVSPDRYYLVFEPWGITDVAVVFLVDRKTGVVNGYQYSTL